MSQAAGGSQEIVEDDMSNSGPLSIYKLEVSGNSAYMRHLRSKD